jgi:hypothetical protein
MLTMRAGISGHENLLPEIRRHAEANIDYFKRNRRFLRFVDTRQKWLLVHLVAVTCHGESDSPVCGAAANWICERASELEIASRNTSLAFLNQLAAYGYLSKRNHRGDRRVKLMSLSESMEAALVDWTRMLIESATGEDISALDRKAVMRIYLDMMTGLLANPKWARAPLDICLTQDMRGGWLVMSEILRHLPMGATAEAWIPARGLSIPAMTESFGLSRSTLYRLVRVSVEAGIMAWEERHAVSTLMVNLYHVRQYSRWIGRLLEAVAASHVSVAGGQRAAEAAAPAGFRVAGFEAVVQPIEARPVTSFGI